MKLTHDQIQVLDLGRNAAAGVRSGCQCQVGGRALQPALPRTGFSSVKSPLVLFSSMVRYFETIRISCYISDIYPLVLVFSICLNYYYNSC